MARNRSLALLLFSTVGGCQGAGGAADMAPPAPDLSGVTYTPATIHQVDIDPGDGPFGDGKYVELRGVVAVSGVDKYVNSTNQQCRYQVWVQDPACKTPPCGLVVKAIGPKAPSINSTGKDCPAARLTDTPLAGVKRGDNFTVRGRLDFDTDDVAPMSVLEHALFVDKLTPLANDATIAPLSITDPAEFAQFVAHSGAGWNKYEGMYVELRPAMGTLQVTAVSEDGFKTIPGNTDWGNTFDSDYLPDGVPAFPTVGATFEAIAGVASARKGGELMPVRNKDFVP